jgi:TRAP-type C4-dicarboxylate transport system permease large subunit
MLSKGIVEGSISSLDVLKGFRQAEVVFKGILPFFLAMVACVVILILFPQIALLLPGLR